MRGYQALGAALQDDAWENRAFTVLAKHIEEDVTQRSNQVIRISQSGRSHEHGSVRVSAAARIDFGGGWTDTPPYSIERGGCVLNAAITLRNANPIIVEALRLPDMQLILESRDIGETLHPVVAGDVLNYANPADPFALLKAALVVKGIVPQETQPETPIADLFAARDGGLHLSSQTTIPRGSGLGTSSVLAGAVVASLDRLYAQTTSETQLFDEVLYLEQILTTGGGWQDQVGGLVDGIKLVTTKPGLPQQIDIDPVQMSDALAAEFGQRLLLVYTGQQRLAKNLLRAVMGRWIARDPEMASILHEIGQLAIQMRDALHAGDLDNFGHLLGQHWLLNKRMDPGCTNPFIDDLFTFMQPYIDGGKLAGAGGGGFAMLIARDEDAGALLAERLKQRYASTPVAIWPCAVASPALRVETKAC